ncbi:hypothetical protein [Celeribacter sp. SCSIO 80788]|uniref:hypothetical protein n=1 Tax=Celeribacter sp. SCSIO 80788 TaxID=3117013 RepID=UPI003DA385C6
MTGETDNSALEVETDNALNSDADNAPDWNYFDPDEDQDNEEVSEEGVTDDEEAETEEEPEAVEAEESEEEPQTAYAEESHVVKLANGEEVTVSDLIQGRMMQADYTRKSQDLANRRKATEAEAQRIESVTTAFIEHISSLIPNEPDAALAYRNPAAYTQQKAAYDSAIAQVQKLMDVSNQAKEVRQGLSDEDRRTMLQGENAKLIERFPEAGTKDGREKFFAGVQSAAEDLGFSAQELSQVSDHRLFALAHWAQKGMAAEKSKKVVREKAQKAAPAAPRKPGQGAKNASRNVEAMRKLSRSGSMKDALAVDFD